MILYTLLTSYDGRDITNIILTACIVYYIGYSVAGGFISDEYNYIGTAILALVDLYMSNNLLQKPRTSGHAHAHAPAPKKPVKTKHRKRKYVKFDPNPTIYNYVPSSYSVVGAQPSMPMMPPSSMPMMPMMQSQTHDMPLIDNRAVAEELESSSSESSIESITVSDTISWSSEEL